MSKTQTVRSVAVIGLIGIWLALGTMSLAQESPGGADQQPGAEASAGSEAGIAVSHQNPLSAISRLGITPDQIASYKQAIAAGGLSNGQLQELIARLAAKGISAAAAVKLARSMGLSEAQISQVQEQLAAEGQGNVQVRQSSGAPSKSEQGADHRSVIERKFALMDKPDLTPPPPDTSHLRQFGYSLFAGDVSRFAPEVDVPVSDDYELGPGDELRIATWGRFSRTMNVKVDRTGSIFVQEVGPIQVAGLTLAQARKLIQGRIDQITGIQSEVTMGRLRTIEVFVLGEVKRPGAYTISALSHISNALIAAGGISKIGSLRRVELRRGGTTVRRLDLYNLLIRGDKRGDIMLKDQDVVFVPIIGPVAAVAGDVKRPAIYELSGRFEPLRQVLKLAGGITAFSYAERIQVLRVENHRQIVALDVNLDRLPDKAFDILDGDLIKIFPVLPGVNDEVILTGNVRRPGSYEWYRGMRISDLIARGEGVAPHTFFSYALLKRLTGADQDVSYRPFNLNRALSDPMSPADLSLKPGDELDIYGEGQMQDQPTVRVEGEVRVPGLYALSRGMRVSDLIYAAGGTRDDAYLERAEIARTEVVDGARTLHKYTSIDLRKALSGDPTQNLVLHSNDELSVRVAPGWHLPYVVTVKGQVLRPGPYTIHPGERLDDLIKRCGGLLPDAFLQGMVFTRSSIRKAEQIRFNEARARLARNLAELQLTAVQGSAPATGLSKQITGLHRLLSEAQGVQVSGRLVIRTIPGTDEIPPSQDVVLQDKDKIVIPRRPVAVNVLGQVYKPTAIVYDPSLTVQDYLQRAGGATELADTGNIFVIKADGSILTSKGYTQSRRSRIFPLLPLISGGLMESRLGPGDTVYVPEKILRVDKVKMAKDVATIIGQSASALGIVGVLAASL